MTPTPELEAEVTKLNAVAAWLSKRAIHAWGDDSPVFYGPADMDAGAEFMLAYALENAGDPFCETPSAPPSSILQMIMESQREEEPGETELEAERDQLRAALAQRDQLQQVADLLADQITYESKRCPVCNVEGINWNGKGWGDPGCSRCGGKGYIRHSNAEFVEWAMERTATVEPEEDNDEASTD